MTDKDVHCDTKNICWSTKGTQSTSLALTAMVTKKNFPGSERMEWEIWMRHTMFTALQIGWQVHFHGPCSALVFFLNLFLNKVSSFVTGRVFHTASAGKFTFDEAAMACTLQGARLATTGQLYLAWQGGMDVCNAGWLGDGSVRYPINVRRLQCGGGQLGVRTVYLHTNQTGYPHRDSRFDAFCYTGTPRLSKDEVMEIFGTFGLL